MARSDLRLSVELLRARVLLGPLGEVLDLVGVEARIDGGKPFEVLRPVEPWRQGVLVWIPWGEL